MSARWMECGPCQVAWRGDEIPCFGCGHPGITSNGPVLAGAATFCAALVEGVPA